MFNFNSVSLTLLWSAAFRKLVGGSSAWVGPFSSNNRRNLPLGEALNLLPRSLASFRSHREGLL